MKIFLKTIVWIISILILIITTETISYFSSSDCAGNEIIFWCSFIAIFFSIYLIFLINKNLKNYEEYKTDYLLFKPKWNLGNRRLFSLLSNFILLIGIGSLIAVPLNLPISCNSLKNWDALGISFWIQLFNITYYWIIVGITNIISWVKSGFEK